MKPRMRIDEAFNIWAEESFENNTEYSGQRILDTSSQEWKFPGRMIEDDFMKKYKREIRTPDEVAEAIYLNLLDLYEFSSDEPLPAEIMIYSDFRRSGIPLTSFCNDYEFREKSSFSYRELTSEEAILINRGLQKLFEPHYQSQKKG